MFFQPIQTALPATGTSSSYTAESNTESVAYEYAGGLLTSVTTDSTTYNFSYDVFGNSSAISVGSQNLASYEYSDYNGKLKTLTYGNGTKLIYEYDELDRVTKICYNVNTNVAYEYKYDSNGNLYQMYDYVSNQVTTYRYDVNGLLIEFFVNNSTDELNQTAITNNYNEEGQLSYQYYCRDYKYNNINGVIRATTYFGYDDYGRLTGMDIGIHPYSLHIGYTYDHLERTNTESYNFVSTEPEANYGYTRTYSYYAPTTDQTSLRISSVTNEYTSSAIANEVFSYTYDDVGNITKIYINGSLKYSYEYDNLGQLTRENNVDTGYTYIYTYDHAGNIDTKKTYTYTAPGVSVSGAYVETDYKYENTTWGDLLTEYAGVTISYDNIGNPITYYTGSASYTMTWTQGRRLATMSGNGQSLSFTYNADGIRTSKIVNGITHYYHLAGTQILSEEWTDANEVQHLIIYHYDANGQPVGMSYRNSTQGANEYESFLFVKNLQGDIIKVLDDEGNLLVSYTYDAWGNPTSTTYSNSGASTAVIYNPFRYRGYYYDSEIGLYYLNSRYYNPVIGRFINADAYISTGQGLLGYNMFAYCNNDPVGRIDPNGYNSEAETLDSWIKATWWLCAADTTLPIGDIIFWGGVAILGSIILISQAQSYANSFVQSTTSTTTKSETKTDDGDFDDPAIYYGARIFNHQFEYVTPPMTREQAISWAFRESSNFGINSSWGIYTADMEDAFEIYNFLVILNPIIEPKELAVYNIIKHYKMNEYPHYHLPGFTFNNRNKHFHIWYGVLGGK